MLFKIVGLYVKSENPDPGVPETLITQALEQDTGLESTSRLHTEYMIIRPTSEPIIGVEYSTADRPFEGVTVPWSFVMDAKKL